MGPYKARGILCALAALLSLVWGAKIKPIKKQREGWGLCLRCLPFGNKMQQSTESWREWWGGYDRRDAATGATATTIVLATAIALATTLALTLTNALTLATTLSPTTVPPFHCHCNCHYH
jgi:hypothetical protein